MKYPKEYTPYQIYQDEVMTEEKHDQMRKTVIPSGKAGFDQLFKAIQDEEVEEMGSFKNEYGEMFIVLSSDEHGLEYAGHETDWKRHSFEDRSFWFSAKEAQAMKKIIDHIFGGSRTYDLAAYPA